jgi:hypothetical protein
MRQTAGDADHLHHVFDPLGAQRIGVADLVGQGQLFIKAVQVADAGVHVHRLHRIAARDVDAVEILRQLHEFLERLEIARAFAAFQVPGVRRRGDVDKQHVLAAHDHLAVRVARGDGEAFGRMASISITKSSSMRTLVPLMMQPPCA